MSGRCVAIALAVLVLPAAGTDTVFGQGCLHGSDEQPSQRVRRTEALQVGQQIHIDLNDMNADGIRDDRAMTIDDS